MNGSSPEDADLDVATYVARSLAQTWNLTIYFPNRLCNYLRSQSLQGRETTEAILTCNCGVILSENEEYLLRLPRADESALAMTTSFFTAALNAQSLNLIYQLSGCD